MKTIGKKTSQAIAVAFLSLSAFMAQGANWTNGADANATFLTTSNWDTGEAPITGETIAFGALSGETTPREGQRIALEAKVDDKWTGDLVWSLGVMTDAEPNAVRRSFTLASNTTMVEKGWRAFTVQLANPNGIGGWWRVLYGGVTVELADNAKLETFSSEGFATVKVAAGTATVGDLASGCTVAKTGAGTLAIGKLTGSDAIIHVKEGGISIAGDEAEPTYADGAALHVDATRRDTLTTVSQYGDGREYIACWKSVDGVAGYLTNLVYSGTGAYVPKAEMPFISPVRAVNDQRLVDFGAATAGKVATLGPQYCLMIPKNIADLKVREVFYAGYYTEDVGNTVFSSTGSFDWLYGNFGANAKPFNADLANPGVLSGDIRMNGRKISYDSIQSEENGTARTSMHVFSTGAWQDTRMDLIGSDRLLKSSCGGLRIGEMIVYTKSLTPAERLATHRYLMRKWLPKERWSQFDADAVSLEAANSTIDVPSGKVRIANVSAFGGHLVKTGAGTLEIGTLTPADAVVEVQGGAVTYAPAAVDATQPASEPKLWLDADNAASFDAVSGDITTWGDTRKDNRDAGWGAHVLPSGTDAPSVKPTRIPAGQNGLATVSLGTSKATSSWLQLTKDISSSYDGFIAVRIPTTVTYGINIFGNSGLDFYRASTTQLLNAGAAWLRGLTARWSVDGAVTDPTRGGALAHDGTWHVVHYSALKPIQVSYLAKDRIGQNTEWGQCEIGEVLFYDRPLTAGERRQTEAYLMRRWCDAAPARAGGAVLKAGGATVGSVTGGAFVKDGEGEMTVTTRGGLDNCPTIAVSGGTLALNYDTTLDDYSYATYALGARWHFDAQNVARMTTESGTAWDGSARTFVTQWQNVVLPDWPGPGADTVSWAYLTPYDIGTSRMVSKPTLQTATIGGVTRPYVDFGKYNKSTDYESEDVKALETAGLKRTGNTFTTGEIHVMFADNPDAATLGYQDVVNSGWNGHMRRNPASADLFGASASSNVKGGYIGLDGKAVTYDTPLGTGFHLVSFAPLNTATHNIGGINFGNNAEQSSSGGSRVAEFLMFQAPLSDSDRAYVQKMMMHRWLGGRLTYVLPQDAVSVADGATLKTADPTIDFAVRNLALAGTADMAALRIDQSLTVGGGTTGVVAKVTGDLDVVAGTTLAFSFFADGTHDVLAVAGKATFEGSVTIDLTADARVAPGDYPLVSAATLGDCDVTAWTLKTTDGKFRIASLYKSGNVIGVHIEPTGLSVIVR